MGSKIGGGRPRELREVDGRGDVYRHFIGPLLGDSKTGTLP